MVVMRRIWASLWQHPGHLIWIALAYFPFLGMMSVPLTGDQKVYLSTAMEMRQTGNWLRPMLFGETSYYKPPLQYWTTLLGWKIFGFNLWGALIPSALCVVLTAWFIGEIARILHGRRAFVNAGLWFAAALGTATYGFTAQMEIYLVLFYAAAWWAGLRFLTSTHEVTGHRNFNWLYLAFVIAGLAALVKSPLYSVLWVVGFFTYLIISGEWDIFRDKRLYIAWVAGIIAGSSWFIAVLMVDGQRFWSDYVLREQLKKVPNGGGPLSLWAALLYFCIPFTLLILPGLRTIWKRRRSEKIKRFIISWVWAPALFFSVYPYRIKPYLYPLLPMMTLIVDLGYLMEGRSRSYRITTILSGILMLVLTGGLAVVLGRAELVPYWILAGFILVGCLSVVSAVKDWMRGLALCALAGVFFFHAASVSLGEADIAGFRRVVEERPTAEVAMLDESRNIWHEVGLLSVAIGKPISRLVNLDQIADFLQAGGLIVLTEDQLNDNERSIEAKLMGRGDLRNVEVLSWQRWRVRSKFPFKELILHGKRDLPNLDADLHREFKIIYL